MNVFEFVYFKHISDHEFTQLYIYRIFPSSGCPIQKAPGVPSVKFEISGSNQGFFSRFFEVVE